MCACALYESMCTHACVCVFASSVFASTALVIVWAAVCLTSYTYSDYLTSFQQLSRCHTSLKKN